MNESQHLPSLDILKARAKRLRARMTQDGKPISHARALELQAQLQRLFPEIDVGGAPDEYHKMVENIGGPIDAPRARCDKARTELGLETHAAEDTLRETAQTTIDLGLAKPKLK